jgi:radical SAM superfamily enzyme YgiQ (UPF0313 family)
MTKVLFLWPFNEKYTPSFSFLQRSKIVKQAGYDVSVIFSNLLFSNDNLSLPETVRNNPKAAFEELISKVNNLNPDHIYIETFDCWSPHLPFTFKFIEALKKRFPSVFISLGGPVPSFFPEKVLAIARDLDVIILGNSEDNVLQFLDEYYTSGSFDKISGIAFKNKREFFIHALSKSSVDMDILPLIDYEDVIGNLPSRFDIRSSKGCIMGCSFCSLQNYYTRPIRLISPERVHKQISHLKYLYNIDYIHFEDEQFISKESHARSIASLFGNHFPEIKWGAMVRIDFISSEILSHFVANNLLCLTVGVESTSKKVLSFLNKHNNISIYINSIYSSIDILIKYVPVLEIGLIIGTPIEHEMDIMDQIDFIRQLKRLKKNRIHIAVGLLSIYPGTQLWDSYQKGAFEMYKRDSELDLYERFFYSDYLSYQWVLPTYYDIINKFICGKENFKSLMKLVFKETL